MEIERKFLVKSLPDLKNVPAFHIVQGYISLEPETRIRKRDDKYFLTIKGEGDVVRSEEEKEVSEKEGKRLFAQVKSYLVKKKRYLINIGKHTAELDIYEDRLKGLTVVEVEFDSLSEAEYFVPPEWFGEDISKNKEYRNKVLAFKP
ncbi:MAG: adenylate cyclase [Clostridia bacterium]|nr:adenylate cyclase [Clostridia bacterium]